MDTSLRDYIDQNKKKISWLHKLHIIFDVVKAIRRIHDEGYVINNLDSSMIFYSKDKHDWYLDPSFLCGANNLRKICGKISYTAPEVLESYDYSKKSDIYSLAIIMCEIINENEPFKEYNLNDIELSMNIIDGLRPQLTVRAENSTSEPLNDLIELCWNKRKDARPNITTIWNEIENLVVTYIRCY